MCMNGHQLMKSIILEVLYLWLLKKLPITLKYTTKVKAKLKKYVSTFFRWSTQHITFTLLDKKFNKSEKSLIMHLQEEQTTVGKNSGCLKPLM